MRFFLDTEFMEDGHTITLLSIGLVAEDGRTFYAEPAWRMWRDEANAWVSEHVVPHLHPLACPDDGHDCPLVFSPVQMRGQIQGFVGKSPEFWGYYAAYDWVVLCQLFGPMIALPKDWPQYCRDLRQALDAQGLTHITQPESDIHHALADAQWIAETWTAYCHPDATMPGSDEDE